MADAGLYPLHSAGCPLARVDSNFSKGEIAIQLKTFESTLCNCYYATWDAK